MNFKRFNRLVALVTFLTFTWQTATAYSMPVLALVPKRLGQVRSVPGTKGTGKTVLFLLNAHTSSDAQKNIAELLKFLQSQGITLIGLEGADEHIDGDMFREFPFKDSLAQAAWQMVKEGEFTGAEYFYITAEKLPKFFGLEDKKLYLENRDAFIQTVKLANELKPTFESLDGSFLSQKKQIYSKPLYHFDREVSRYQSRDINYFDHLRMLVRTAVREHIDVTQFANLYALSKAIEKEKRFTESGLRKDLEKLSASLRGKAEAIPSEIASLIAPRVARNDSVSVEEALENYKKIHAYFSDVILRAKPEESLPAGEAGQNGDPSLALRMTASAYGKHLSRYFEWLSLFVSLDVTKLMDELSQLTELSYERLAKTDEEKKLLRSSEDYSLLKKMAALELTQKEWERVAVIARSPAAAGRRSNLGTEIASTLSGILSRNDEDGVAKLRNLHSTASRFYELAEKRNEIFAKRIEKQMSKTRQNVSVVVIGGFHEKGLKAALEAKGLATAVISPKINEALSDIPYLERMVNGPAQPKQITAEVSTLDLALDIARIPSAEERLFLQRRLHHSAAQLALKNGHTQAEIDAALGRSKANFPGARKIAPQPSFPHVLSGNPEILTPSSYLLTPRPFRAELRTKSEKYQKQLKRAFHQLALATRVAQQHPDIRAWRQLHRANRNFAIIVQSGPNAIPPAARKRRARPEQAQRVERAELRAVELALNGAVSLGLLQPANFGRDALLSALTFGIIGILVYIRHWRKLRMIHLDDLVKAAGQLTDFPQGLIYVPTPLTIADLENTIETGAGMYLYSGSSAPAQAFAHITDLDGAHLIGDHRIFLLGFSREGWRKMKPNSAAGSPSSGAAKYHRNSAVPSSNIRAAYLFDPKSKRLLPVPIARAELRAVLPRINPETTAAWKKLKRLAKQEKKWHLRDLLRDRFRAQTFTSQLFEGRLRVDFSKQKINSEVFQALIDLAYETELGRSIELMLSGANINEVEGRAALHTALRAPADRRIYVNGTNVMPEVSRVLAQIKDFSQRVISGEWKGYAGDEITDVVNFGIGGSSLGPEAVSEALQPYAQRENLSVHFVSNVDGNHIDQIIRRLKAKHGENWAKKTLFIVASKSFTTDETITNATTAKEEFLKVVSDPEAIKKHFVAVSTATEKVTQFGIATENIFNFWDWVGGRYSVWSAVGLSVACYIGFENFREFLDGAYDMDVHFRTEPFDQNVPVLLGLIDIWNIDHRGVNSLIFQPYDQSLDHYPDYLQQLFMESNGKGMDRNGRPVTYQTEVDIWGTPGSNGQHSYMQKHHQGMGKAAFEYMAAAISQNERGPHQLKLLSHALGQPRSLALGRTSEEVQKALAGKSPEEFARLSPFEQFHGDRPSTFILYDKLTPRMLGRILAMQEHRTAVKGFIWNIFSFDQPGVQDGKARAGDIYAQLVAGEIDSKMDPSTAALMENILKMRAAALSGPVGIPPHRAELRAVTYVDGTQFATTPETLFTPDLAKLGAKLREMFPNLPEVAFNPMNGGMANLGQRVYQAMGLDVTSFNMEPMDSEAVYPKVSGFVADPTGKQVRFAPDPTRKHMRGESYNQFIEGHPDVISQLIDGDADRLVAEQGGREIIPNEIGAMAYYVLRKYFGQKGKIVRTAPTTETLDLLVEAFEDEPVIETGVGSKFFKPFLKELSVAVEESGHIVFRYKGQLFFDHSLALSLLMFTMMAETGKTWQELLNEMWQFITEETGNPRLISVRTGISKAEGAERYYSAVADLAQNEGARSRFGTKVAEALQGWKFIGVSTADKSGPKFRFKGHRSFMLRKSGTDGSIRIYIEVLEMEKHLVPQIVEAIKEELEAMRIRSELRNLIVAKETNLQVGDEIFYEDDTGKRWATVAATGAGSIITLSWQERDGTQKRISVPRNHLTGLGYDSKTVSDSLRAKPRASEERTLNPGIARRIPAVQRIAQMLENSENPVSFVLRGTTLKIVPSHNVADWLIPPANDLLRGLQQADLTAITGVSISKVILIAHPSPMTRAELRMDQGETLILTAKIAFGIAAALGIGVGAGWLYLKGKMLWTEQSWLTQIYERLIGKDRKTDKAALNNAITDWVKDASGFNLKEDQQKRVLKFVTGGQSARHTFWQLTTLGAGTIETGRAADLLTVLEVGKHFLARDVDLEKAGEFLTGLVELLNQPTFNEGQGKITAAISGSSVSLDKVVAQIVRTRSEIGETVPPHLQEFLRRAELRMQKQDGQVTVEEFTEALAEYPNWEPRGRASAVARFLEEQQKVLAGLKSRENKSLIAALLRFASGADTNLTLPKELVAAPVVSQLAGLIQNRSELRKLQIRDDLERKYPDVYTPEAIAALKALAHFNRDQKAIIGKRTQRRNERIKHKLGIEFLDPNADIPRTHIKVQDARDGKFVGSEIPHDLEWQWIQGTGPAARPHAETETNLRNVAYALLSGADGWMFDGEDAAGQIEDMSLETQRSLKLAIRQDSLFIKVAEQVAEEMNTWARGFFGHEIIQDWKKQLDFTTKIFRTRGLHLDDRHVKDADGIALSASIVDLVLYVVNNYQRLLQDQSSIVLYLPKIQTAEEAALWNEMMIALENHLGLPEGTIKVYVLVEQLEATFQLMEIRAALGKHFVGFNTGRWDYINSVSDAMAGADNFINPNIEAITMTYGYMRNYEDRVRRAVNTPDLNGNFALWQGGMEPNIPVGSKEGIQAAMKKAVAGAEREQKAGASGKWVAHWKMVHIVRPVWKKISQVTGEVNQLGRTFPPLTYTQDDAKGLTLLEDAPRTIRGARNLLSVALQYGNAFGQGYQAAALKPADFFGNDDVLYLMEDMATGEIRLSILWEWIHKGAKLTEDDPETGFKKGDVFTADVFRRLLAEEYEKLLRAGDKDVHDDSKTTTLPIAREIAEAYVLSGVKFPWYIDLLNLNLNNHDLETAKRRIALYIDAFKKDGTRITENLDFASARAELRSTPVELSTAPASAGTPKSELRIANRAAAIDQEEADYEKELREADRFMHSKRFQGIRRHYTAKHVVEQREELELQEEYRVAKAASTKLYSLFREMFKKGRQVTSFGPFSPLEAIKMIIAGIRVIYLGGWATSAKGSDTEEPGSDLANYALDRMPKEGAVIVNAARKQAKIQKHQRMNMTKAQRRKTKRIDFTPLIIMDGDTGHGGEHHVRNLVRQSVEKGISGIHIEDQKPGCKVCGHQGNKVLVSTEEQLRRLHAARLQYDIMGVPGVIVARTDAKDAVFIDSNSDERDHRFILGATNQDIVRYKSVHLAVLKHFYDRGIKEVNGHQMHQISDAEYEKANTWLEKTGLMKTIDDAIDQVIALLETDSQLEKEVFLDEVVGLMTGQVNEVWHSQADLKIFQEAVADQMRARIVKGETFEITVEQWLEYANSVSNKEARQKAKSLGIHIFWDWESPQTPEGYFQITGGLEMAIARGLAMAPYADVVWVETKTPDLKDAKAFADAIHAVYPDKMLAYNLSPSFNWDAFGMTDKDMREFNKKLGKLGYVFNFITYGGHQAVGLAIEELSRAVLEEGVFGFVRLVQRRLRLIGSGLQFPQSFVGGKIVDAFMRAAKGLVTVTGSMGGKSTEAQHRKKIEVPTSLLEEWLGIWAKHNQFDRGPFRVELLPTKAGSEEMMLNVFDKDDRKIAHAIFKVEKDRRGRVKLEITDKRTDPKLRRTRLNSLTHLFLIHRFKVGEVHYISPNRANRLAVEGMVGFGLYQRRGLHITPKVIIAEVNPEKVQDLVSNETALRDLISKTSRAELRTAASNTDIPDTILKQSISKIGVTNHPSAAYQLSTIPMTTRVKLIAANVRTFRDVIDLIDRPGLFELYLGREEVPHLIRALMTRGVSADVFTNFGEFGLGFSVKTRGVITHHNIQNLDLLIKHLNNRNFIKGLNHSPDVQHEIARRLADIAPEQIRFGSWLLAIQGEAVAAQLSDELANRWLADVLKMDRAELRAALPQRTLDQVEALVSRRREQVVRAELRAIVEDTLQKRAELRDWKGQFQALKSGIDNLISYWNSSSPGLAEQSRPDAEKIYVKYIYQLLQECLKVISGSETEGDILTTLSEKKKTIQKLLRDKLPALRVNHLDEAKAQAFESSLQLTITQLDKQYVTRMNAGLRAIVERIKLKVERETNWFTKSEAVRAGILGDLNQFWNLHHEGLGEQNRQETKDVFVESVSELVSLGLDVLRRSDEDTALEGLHNKRTEAHQIWNVVHSSLTSKYVDQTEIQKLQQLIEDTLTQLGEQYSKLLVSGMDDIVQTARSTASDIAAPQTAGSQVVPAGRAELRQSSVVTESPEEVKMRAIVEDTLQKRAELRDWKGRFQALTSGINNLISYWNSVSPGLAEQSRPDAEKIYVDSIYQLLQECLKVISGSETEGDILTTLSEKKTAVQALLTDRDITTLRNNHDKAKAQAFESSVQRTITQLDKQYVMWMNAGLRDIVREVKSTVRKERNWFKKLELVRVAGIKELSQFWNYNHEGLGEQNRQEAKDVFVESVSKLVKLGLDVLRRSEKDTTLEDLHNKRAGVNQFWNDVHHSFTSNHLNRRKMQTLQQLIKDTKTQLDKQYSKLMVSGMDDIVQTARSAASPAVDLKPKGRGRAEMRAASSTDVTNLRTIAEDVASALKTEHPDIDGETIVKFFAGTDIGAYRFAIAQALAQHGLTAPMLEELNQADEGQQLIGMLAAAVGRAELRLAPALPKSVQIPEANLRNAGPAIKVDVSMPLEIAEPISVRVAAEPIARKERPGRPRPRPPQPAALQVERTVALNSNLLVETGRLVPPVSSEAALNFSAADLSRIQANAPKFVTPLTEDEATRILTSDLNNPKVRSELRALVGVAQLAPVLFIAEPAQVRPLRQFFDRLRQTFGIETYRFGTGIQVQTADDLDSKLVASVNDATNGAVLVAPIQTGKNLQAKLNGSKVVATDRRFMNGQSVVFENGTLKELGELLAAFLLKEADVFPAVQNQSIRIADQAALARFSALISQWLKAATKVLASA